MAFRVECFLPETRSRKLSSFLCYAGISALTYFLSIELNTNLFYFFYICAIVLYGLGLKEEPINSFGVAAYSLS